MDRHSFDQIEPDLTRAVKDLKQFLARMDAADQAQEETLEEMRRLHARLEDGERLSDGPAAPRLTREQYAALDWRTVDGQPIGDEEREAILNDAIPGEPISDEEQEALQAALRWRGSSRKAAYELRRVGEAGSADKIGDVLRELPELTQPWQASGYRDAIRGAAEHIRAMLQGYLDEGPSAASETVRAAADPAAENGSDAVRSLLRAYAPGLADDRIEQACRVLAGGRTANEKLSELDRLLPIPPHVSAEKLGAALGVTKQAVVRTSWWKRTRKGRRDEAAGEREDRLRQRGQNYEWDGRALDDE